MCRMGYGFDKKRLVTSITLADLREIACFLGGQQLICKHYLTTTNTTQTAAQSPAGNHAERS